MSPFEEFLACVRHRHPGERPVPLHEPCFDETEQRMVARCVAATFVSTFGPYVERFEQRVAELIGARHAVAVVNGTSALFIALHAAGVGPGCEVLTQGLTFVATANAIRMTGAEPVFLDVDPDTLGLSPEALRRFLATTRSQGGRCVNPRTGRRVTACVPVHIFGHPCRVDELRRLADEHGLLLLEDAAESLGSSYRDRHTGTFGHAGILSFNGNKIITTGGGGMVVTGDQELAGRVRHLVNVAKVPHPHEYLHDRLGYNLRLPNLNASLGLAQLEKMPRLVADKRRLARRYAEIFDRSPIELFREPPAARSNYWLNALRFPSRAERDAFVERCDSEGVATRLAWRPLPMLEMYRDCQRDDQSVVHDLYQRLLNVPSSGRLDTSEGGSVAPAG